MISGVYTYASFYVIVCLLISGICVILCLMIYWNENWRIIVFCFITPYAAVLKHIFYEASNINRVLFLPSVMHSRMKYTQINPMGEKESRDNNNKIPD